MSMPMITLIATKHKEKGLCSPNELYKIIERIAPEIIFEEVPPSKFAAVYKGSRKDSLETGTIKRYLQQHPIDHIPVDLDTEEVIDRTIKNHFQKISYTFCYYSPEYNYLSNQLASLSEQFGFPYLNGDQCSRLMERKLILELHLLRIINNEMLSNAYTDLSNYLDQRREEMISRIYSYSDFNKYDRALFLVGAEHRKPIMDKVHKFENANKQKLDWNFNYFN